MCQRRSFVANFLLISVVLLMAQLYAKASDTFTVLYDFNYATGALPVGNLILDSAGNLYGTAVEGGLESPNCSYNCGVVFELSPSGSTWTYKVLYYFTGGADGSQPHGRLTRDSKGNLYGTTFNGGTVNGYCPVGCGTIFELSPVGSDWTFALIHSFTGPDGLEPGTGLTPDNAGNLYGVTEGGGTADGGTFFELVPSDGGWTFSTLYEFTSFSNGFSPSSDLVIDGSGDFYGATFSGGSTKPSCLGYSGCGTIFELSPAGGSWKFRLLHAFQGIKAGAKDGDGIYPAGSLALDGVGNLYGTTSQGGKTCNSCGGTVFKLLPSAGKWKEQILHRFGGTYDGLGPPGGVTLDKAGNLYGTTHDGGTNCGDCGTVFKLTPDTKGASWKLSLLYSFTDGADGGEPDAGVISDTSGNLYGTTTYWGENFGGTLFELSTGTVPPDRINAPPLKKAH
jgi:uncharacterized repeat protein (TIGR03803 family)